MKELGSRRYFFKRAALLALATGILRPAAVLGLSVWQNVSRRYLRPPGALDEADFLKTCINCGQCTKHCPQSIAIPQELQKVKRQFEGPLSQILLFVINQFINLGKRVRA